ncbi:MAG: xanthine dehydrogenase small subunit [Bacteroidales bacterium]|nr:xanthine dehydrogenase small subunit [Bacteroidales bacterium]MCF8404710.1 xanthine dehydrogenase small subunit [Bacteroidales bacterium]
MKTQSYIQFILDGKIVSLDFNELELSPTTTVLNYLRSLSGHKGVKEGCAEGDCGACTVVVAEKTGKGNLIYKAINSCLVFLPQIHGKQLITVENLALKKGGKTILHPVQQAMVDLNGSQCGYCTPGFIMSMFAFYKNSESFDRAKIEDALTGNLCRCTGYEPIIKASIKSLETKPIDHFSETEVKTANFLEKIKSDSLPLKVILKTQKYFRPDTLANLFHFIDLHPEAILISGASDIALRQTKKFEHIPSVIDLSGITELIFAKETNNGIELGSGLSLESLRNFVSTKIPSMKKMLDVFASKQIREIATLGGNLGTASPIGDSIPILIALNAKVVLINKSGKRELLAEDFIKGYRSTKLAKKEIILSVFIPNNEKSIVKFYKVSKRKDLDISTLSAGMSIILNNKKVEDICLVYGGMAEMPKRALKAESFLKGKPWNETSVKQAMEILREEFTPLSDARSGIEFRKLAAKNLLLKFYSETIHE